MGGRASARRSSSMRRAPAPPLLGGLEGEMDGAREGGLAGFERAGGAEEHGDVAVVAAGVHPSRVGAASLGGDVGRLGDGERVHVRAEEHDGGGAGADRREDAGGERSACAMPIASSSRLTMAEVFTSVHINSGTR